MFESFTGQPGKVLKHLVDMYHYRKGGYPNESSPPKHQELIERFAWMVLWFDFIGLSHLYKDELKAFGITVIVSPEYKIKDAPIAEEAMEVFAEMPEFMHYLAENKKQTFKQAIRAFLFLCDEIQGQICSNSNVIKKQIGPAVEENCDIRKGDFSSAVMVNYTKATGRVTKKKFIRMKKNFRSKIETGSFNIKNVQTEIPEQL